MKYVALSLFALFVSGSVQAASPATSNSIATVYAPTCTPDGKFCASFAPTDMPVHAVASALKSAKKTIRIATYNMDVVELIDVLNEKIAEGVKVEFAVDYKLSFGSNLVWRSLKAGPNLLKYRLPVFRGSNPQMHNKIISVDNEVVLFGSANFTYSGLVANYENVLAVRDAAVVAKFNAELDELRANALAACATFAEPTSACGQGTEKWDANFHKLLAEGRLPDTVVAKTDACINLTNGRGGFLDERNVVRVDLDQCITDEGLRAKMKSLAATIADNEKYADGSRTDSSAFRAKASQPPSPVEVYFSPEDNVQRTLLRELSKTLDNPANSYALISTNFITNRSLAEKLVQMHKAGVKMRIFFDRGRIDDPNFQQQVETLKGLPLTVFDNKLTGPYGSNHNKMAVVAVDGKLTLLDGSANWSLSAMTRNDENLVVIRDSAISSIYIREIVSQLFVYQYGQDPANAEYKSLLADLTRHAPCLPALLGNAASCELEGRTWKPKANAVAVLSLEGAPVDPATEQVWVWVRQIEEKNGVKALPLFTHEVFAGRWLTTVPLPVGWNMQFKFFKLPKGQAPEQGIPNDAWEYQGGSDRNLTLPPSAVHVVREIYRWGHQ